MTGGFVGVDVFFVISGFVIALSLQRELVATGTVRLRTFYARRARRLLPALALVSIVVLLVTAQQLDVLGGRQSTAETARAAALFVANIQLEHSGGYFAPAATENPLLHTWSLSVEEQFYVVMPALMLVAWRLGRRAGTGRSRSRAKLAFASVAVVSFVAASATVGGGQQRAAFYGTPLRAWEFALGALLALNVHRLQDTGVAARRALAVVGGAVLVAVSIVYSSATPFPGAAAAAPVLATVALIASGSGGRGPASLLQWKPLVWVGDRSYSWYLWHWPAIVFATALWGESIVRNVAAAAVALVPAAISHSLVEEPLRRERRLVGLSVAALALIVITSTVAWSFVVERDADAELAANAPELVSGRADLETPCGNVPWPAERCIGGSESALGTVVLLGDSHAISLEDVVTAAASQLGYRTATFSRPGCPATTVATDYEPDCSAWNAQLISSVRALEPAAIVVANRSPAYVDSPVGQPLANLVDDGDGSVVTGEARSLELWDQGIRMFLDALDVPTLIVRTVPEYPNGRLDSIVGTDVDDEDVPVLPLSYLTERSGAVARVEAAIAADRAETVVFDPASVICDETRCRPRADGKWLYFDDDHLSSFGAAMLGPAIRDDLQRLLSGELRQGDG